MKLYEINGAIQSIEAQIDQALTNNDTEALGALKASLDELSLAKNDKIQNIAQLIISVEHYASALEAECAKLREWRDRAESKASWLKAYLADSIEPGTKLALGPVAIGWRKSASVEVTDENAIPQEFIRYEKVIVKSKLKDALEAEQVVPGAFLKRKNNIQIR